MTSLSQMRLLAVHAHPDDESSKGAATMAHYVQQGVEVMVATCTGGERGSILNAQMEGHPHAERDLAGLRRWEMAQAAAALEVRHRWLGFMDSGLPEGDPLPPLPWGCFALQPLERAAAPLVRLVREFRPHVILTYDENGGYPHPDHIQTHHVSVEAFRAAGDPDRYPGLGEPWTPLKLYYDRAFNLERFVARVPGHLRPPRRGAAQPPHPGGPGRDVLRGVRRDAGRGVAVGGLRPRRVPGGDRPAGERPVRRDRGLTRR